MNKLSKKEKTIRKQYKEKFLTIAESLRNQADKKNQFDCKPILDELNEASLNGEYSRTIQLKVNQAHYIATLGLNVINSDKFGYYEISWK
jgi:hypothetical protein